MWAPLQIWCVIWHAKGYDRCMKNETDRLKKGSYKKYSPGINGAIIIGNSHNPILFLVQ